MAVLYAHMLVQLRMKTKQSTTMFLEYQVDQQVQHHTMVQCIIVGSQTEHTFKDIQRPVVFRVLQILIVHKLQHIPV